MVISTTVPERREWASPTQIFSKSHHFVLFYKNQHNYLLFKFLTLE